MRRYGHLFDTAASPANLWRAWRELRRGKRNRSSVRAFERGAELRVHRLHRELVAARYRPAGYQLKLLLEPKRRLIAAAACRSATSPASGGAITTSTASTTS